MPPVIEPPTLLQLAKVEVYDVLMSPAAQAIDFTFGAHRVDGTGYFEVMRAIQSERIDVILGGIPAGAGAAYNDHPYQDSPARDTLFLPETPPISKRTYHMYILHECTHALIDMRKSAGTAGENEAAAYVAGALFLLKSGSLSDETKEPFKAAQKIARRIVSSPGASVSAADRTAMLTGLLSNGKLYPAGAMATPDAPDGLARPPVIPRFD